MHTGQCVWRRQSVGIDSTCNLTIVSPKHSVTPLDSHVWSRVLPSYSAHVAGSSPYSSTTPGRRTARAPCSYRSARPPLHAPSRRADGPQAATAEALADLEVHGISTAPKQRVAAAELEAGAADAAAAEALFGRLREASGARAGPLPSLAAQAGCMRTAHAQMLRVSAARGEEHACGGIARDDPRFLPPTDAGSCATELQQTGDGAATGAHSGSALWTPAHRAERERAPDLHKVP